MRGKLLPIFPCQKLLGNIPAYAGKTSADFWIAKTPREHPRVCGENRKEKSWLLKLTGTSPRMRGKPATENNLINFLGNIPAYAGKTACPATCSGAPQEHPRVCGENGWSFLFYPMPLGTSPRMRGKRNARIDYVCETRNIPAYAGKTTSNARCARRTEEHPRVCGENLPVRSP